jgi:hypothetical protein
MFEAWARIKWLRHREPLDTQLMIMKLGYIFELEGIDQDDVDDMVKADELEVLSMADAVRFRMIWDHELSEGWEEEDEGDEIPWDFNQFMRTYKQELNDRVSL